MILEGLRNFWGGGFEHPNPPRYATAQYPVAGSHLQPDESTAHDSSLPFQATFQYYPPIYVWASRVFWCLHFFPESPISNSFLSCVPHGPPLSNAKANRILRFVYNIGQDWRTYGTRDSLLFYFSLLLPDQRLCILNILYIHVSK